MEIEWLGPYQIVGKLGRGGMGAVYEGVHRENGEAAAIKLLSPALAQEEGFRVRFEAEIETLRKLNHPNIVRLFGFGEQDGHLFYAMELVDGNSLEEELQRGRRFDWRETARIGIEICRALAHAHDRGIIHRDIKPGNLLLAKNGQVKLSDFGIARLFGNARLTSAGNVLGTAEYMAPEQAEGRPVDGRADLYSLGALLYALLARRAVFRGRSLPEMLHKQRFERPEPLRKHAPDVPVELASIIEQLLEKEPERRIPNARVLGRRLGEVLQALTAGPETIDADADWFDLDDISSSPESKTPPGLSDIPATQELSRLVEDVPATQAPVESLSPKNRTTESVAAKTTGDGVASNGRFVVVAEDELDPLELEEQRPAIISWQTWVLAGTLLAIGLGAWWSLQPPKADTLYRRIEAKADNASIDSLADAEDDIKDFLNRYSDDPRAERLRKYQREIDLNKLERRLEKQMNGYLRAEGLLPIEQMYLEAISHTRLNPTLAMTKLQAIVDLYHQPGDESGRTGECLTLARRRLVQLQGEVEKLAKEQRDAIGQRLDEADALGKNDPQQAQAIYRAVIELYGDKPWADDLTRRAQKAISELPDHGR